MKNKILLDLFLTIIIILCYFPSFWGEFVFDDVEAIVKNVDVRHGNYLEVFHHDFWGNDIGSAHSHKSYRPLTTLVYRVLFESSTHICTLFGQRDNGPHIDKGAVQSRIDYPNATLYRCLNVLIYCVLACQL